MTKAQSSPTPCGSSRKPLSLCQRIFLEFPASPTAHGGVEPRLRVVSRSGGFRSLPLRIGHRQGWSEGQMALPPCVWNLCARRTGACVAGASPVKGKVNHHFCREPCVGHQEGSGEASVAVHVGKEQGASRMHTPECRGSEFGRRQHPPAATGEAKRDSAASKNHCMHACTHSIGTWEVSRLPRSRTGPQRKGRIP